MTQQLLTSKTTTGVSSELDGRGVTYVAPILRFTGSAAVVNLEGRRGSTWTTLKQFTLPSASDSVWLRKKYDAYRFNVASITGTVSAYLSLAGAGHQASDIGFIDIYARELAEQALNLVTGDASPTVSLAALTTSHLAANNVGAQAYCNDVSVAAPVWSDGSHWKLYGSNTVVTTDPSPVDPPPVGQRYYTLLGPTTYAMLDSPVVFTGDFTARISGNWPGTHKMYLFATDGNFNEDMIINMDGSVRFSIHEEHMDSAAAALTAGRFDLEFKRVGLVGTVTNKLTNAVIKTASFSFLDTASFSKIGASDEGPSTAGVIDGVTVNGYEWQLDQGPTSEVITAVSGGVNGLWHLRLLDDDHVSKYGLVGGVLTNVDDPTRTI